MSYQLGQVPFGTDATTISGYAIRASDRLGTFDVAFENVGTNTAYIKFLELVSGYPAYTYNSQSPVLGVPFTVGPGNLVTKHLSVTSEQIGLFGSGNTQVAVTLLFRNPADRRASPLLELIAVGKQNWGFAPGYNQNAFQGSYPNI